VITQDALLWRISLSSAFQPYLFGDLRDRTHYNDAEEGLEGIAFSPQFQTDGRLYLYYVRKKPPGSPLYALNVLSRFQVSGNVLDAASEETLIALDDHYKSHIGGQLYFGPDGYLYVSTGDEGGPGDVSQDTDSLFGKLLRLDVSGASGYTSPPGNPFVGVDGRDEIWAYGFRNPWRCSFDMAGSRELFCGDVGQNSYEEVNIVRRGGNHGWRVKEGTHCFDYVNPNTHPPACDDTGMINPIVEYQNCNVFPECKGISVTGGYVYRGSHAPWQGKYLFGDWSKAFPAKDGQLYVASKDGVHPDAALFANLHAPDDLRAVVDERGGMHARNNGSVGPQHAEL